jgi:hypothetical protein
MRDLKIESNDGDAANRGEQAAGIDTGITAREMAYLDRRSPEVRAADQRLEALLDEALAPMALVGPPGTSERAPLENGLAERIFNASKPQLPGRQNEWAVAFRSPRVWLSFAASMTVALSAGWFIHSTTPKATHSQAMANDISAVDQQLSRLASYSGPSAQIDRDIAELSLKFDQAGSAQLWSDAHENVPTANDW